MRIIAGKFKGRVLNSPDGAKVRPTADFVKEALFNVLQGRITGADFLDLFCGSGAVGLEALSRGAEHAVFVDSSRESIVLAKGNAALLRADPGAAEFINQNCQSVLLSFGAAKKSFDIIFLDPPYDIAEDEKVQILDSIFGLKICNPGGVVVFEMHREKKLSFSQKQYIITDERCYGIKKLVYLTYTEEL